jgi:peptide/nickel transport system permease protein
MTTYIIRRFLQGTVTLIMSTLAIFGILTITPGGPVDQYYAAISVQGPDRPNIVALKAIIRALKLDSPFPISYMRWLFDPSDTTRLDPNDSSHIITKGVDLSLGSLRIQGSGILTGDFGNSVIVAKGQSVLGMMGARLGNTLALTVTALVLSVLVALVVGVISAIRQYSRLDYMVTAFSFVGISMPAFWLGLMLVVFLGVLPKQMHDQGWDWLPYMPTGFAYDLDQDQNTVNRIFHLILPVTVLAFVSVAGFSRFVRASMLEVLQQDYVRTAWAKGLKQRSVILRHVLRNALIPLITIVTLSLPALFSGAIATEAIFAYPGMGQLFITAVNVLDIPLLMAFLLIITTLIIFSNILADVLYAVADPRISYS